MIWLLQVLLAVVILLGQTFAATPMRLVVLGDSITAPANPCGASWPTYLSVPVAHNAGIGGNTTAQMLARLDIDVLAYHPTDVTIMGGTNDIYAAAPLSWSLDNLGQIIDRVRASGARAWLLTVPPFTRLPVAPFTNEIPVVMAYNAALPTLAAAHGARLIDIAALLSGSNGDWSPGLSCEGIHPNAAGAQLIADAVQTALK